MPYLLVSDFIGGQDVRKSEFTAPPGTLRRLINAHITRGGEVEKRKTFEAKYTLPAGTAGLHSVNGELIVYGTGARPVDLPSEIVYFRVSTPSGTTEIDRVLSTDNFGGVAYAVVQFQNGAIEHFYGDQRVEVWDDIAFNIVSRETLASAFAVRVNNSGVFYTAEDVADTDTEARFTITGVPDEPFGVSGNAKDDETWAFSTTQLQASAAEIPAVPPSAATAEFTITGGTESATAGTNGISSITVGGVEILNEFVDFVTDAATTAQAVADQINLYTSSPDYTSSTVSNIVKVTAPAEDGASANGRAVVITVAGDATVSGNTELAGGDDGADKVDALPEIIQVAITDTGTGSQLASAAYNVTITAVSDTIANESFELRLAQSSVATYIRTFADQMYGAAQKVLRYTGFRLPNPQTNPVGSADPTAWDTGAPDVVNAGLIDMSTQDGANDDVVAVGAYQNRIAIFSRRYIQIWATGPAPEDKQQLQVLNNLGTLSPKTVASFGDQDVFFLSESGVRSLRARDSSNLASAADVGNPIDPELVDFALRQTPEDVRQAVALVEPSNGRYWLALADRMYVFSFFGSSKVSAWSTYTLPGRIDYATLSDGRVWFRVGETVYRYGGVDNLTYDDQAVEVRTPFMDGDNPAQHKSWQGIDVGIEGVWQVWIATDPEQPEVEEEIGVFGKASFSQLRVPMVAQGSHISVRLRSVGSGYHRLTSMAIHYEGFESG